VQQTRDLDDVALSAAVEAELPGVQEDELELGLEVVAEAEDFGATEGGPAVGDFLELVGVKAAVVELGGDVAVDGAAEVELELAVEEGLLARVERDGDGRVEVFGSSCSFFVAGYTRGSAVGLFGWLGPSKKRKAVV
jgi:hypothetical protein